MSTTKVKPLLAGGFCDYLPEQQIRRAAIIRRVQAIYERFGFDPLETPAVERLDVLTGGQDDLDKLLYRTFPSKGGRWLGREPDQRVSLRFDLTVPLARVVAANPDIPKPWKRYQVGAVWRGEKPQLGRYREFLQFDADIVGASSPLADAEMVVIMHTVLSELGLPRFTIRVNDRKVLNGLAAKGGFAHRAAEVIRVLDKHDDLGIDGVLAQLRGDDAGGEDDAAERRFQPLERGSVDLVERFLRISGSAGAAIDPLDALLGDVPLAAEGIRGLRIIAETVAEAGVREDRWRVDPTVARGLDYYTGPVWEAVLDDKREIGTVYSGGRYDGLVGRFMGDAVVPCTGISVGVDRLFAGMESLGMIESAGTVTEVLIVNFAPELTPDYQRLARELRAAGINTSIYLGEDLSFKAQIAYAARQSVPIVLIYGPDDRAAGRVQLKDMRARSQEPVAWEHVAAEVQRRLGR